MKKIIVSIFAVMVICLLFTGCSDANIKMVQTGSLEDFKGLPIGKVFDNYKYFISKSWRSIKSDDGKIIVEFNGVLQLSESQKKAGIKSASVLFQFLVLNKKGSIPFILAYSEAQTTNNNGEVETTNLTPRVGRLLAEIFANNAP